VNQKLALRVLGEIMDWDDTRAQGEFRWLSLMSRLKYDGYQDFLAGVRFIESLTKWLQQFQTSAERDVAYQFVRCALVYIGPAEMLRLVESFYPDHVERELAKTVAAAHRVPSYRVWATQATAAAYDELLRKTLFIGLSEGARLDLFRRANAGTISHEQVLLATYINREKWNGLLDDLRAETKDANARFRVIYLIDDFVGSGTTLIRRNQQSGEWKGKLAHFRETVVDVLSTHFEPSTTICVHHYLANHRATEVLVKRHSEALAELGPTRWFANVHFTFGTVLPKDLPITHSNLTAAQNFIPLARKYFDPEDPSLTNRHTNEGGTDVALGFAECALPLVLEHNTPNNSVALLWAETDGGKADNGHASRHAMRPLFRRRHRHT
jgi:hypothetical protein